MADRTAATTLSGPPQRRAPLPSLTGLRFLAAMLVFLTHASLLAGPLRPAAPIGFFSDTDIAKPLADFFAPAGSIGVSFFFVLSGFVLAWSATHGDRPTAFWRRRALKIYPNHLVTFVLAMWLFASSTPLHAWLPNLFLVHNFSNRPETISSVNLPAWSLCSEVLFYALFPVLIVLVRRIAERRLWLWAAAAVAGVAGVPVITQFITGGAKLPGYGMTMNQLWFSYGFPPPRLFEFVFGMILARIVAAGLWPRIGLLPSAAVFAAGYWAALSVPYPYNFSLTTIIPFGMIICAAASSDLRGDGGWLTSRTMLWLGNVSFAFYLVQGLVIFYGRPELLDARTFSTVPAIGLLIALFLANLLAAWLLYRLVEQPMMRRWARDRSSERTPPPQAVPRSADPVPAGEPA
jgi:peptidoglycan/LPS O-acetylase OafA/YrhL